MPEEASMREAYGRTLVELGKTNPDIVVLDADLCASTMTKYFMQEFPERSFDVGIAEQNMIGIAAGLAASGKIPFASTFAVFAPGRCFDQIRMSIAQSKLNVKLVVTHGGLSVGEDGTSHQAIEDLSLICSLPGFTVIVPADAVETVAAVKAVADLQGPCYIRLGRPRLPVVFDENYRFKPGQAVTMRAGTDATIIAIGIMVAPSLDAAEILTAENISCRVINMSTLKPVDEAAILKAAAETGAVVTAEEHLEHGGLGSTVARILAQKNPVPVEFVAIRDTYASSGKPAELLERFGLTARDIAVAVRKVIKRKS
jgi:transketolase